MIKCEALPDLNFATKRELFDALVENEAKIIQLKKASIQKAADKGQIAVFELLREQTSQKAGFTPKQGFVYPVINTTNYMDSHDDVHFNGIWDKSLKEQQGRVFYVSEHTLSVPNVIAWPQDVNMMVKNVPWSFVGKTYTGETQALIFEIEKTKIAKDWAREVIEQNRPVQNSIRMQYVKIRLAINDDADDFKEHKAYFDEKISVIANKEKALERGYFWGIEEAKIVQEGSMVLFGSNDATPIKTEAAQSTSKTTEPDNSTHEFLKLLTQNL